MFFYVAHETTSSRTSKSAFLKFLSRMDFNLKNGNLESNLKWDNLKDSNDKPVQNVGNLSGQDPLKSSQPIWITPNRVKPGLEWLDQFLTYKKRFFVT